MKQYQWNLKQIQTEQDLTDCLELIQLIQPTVGAFDTEATGLHITNAIPFLYQFGFLDDINKIGYVFLVDIEETPILAKETIRTWQEIAKDLNIYLGHNVKFDLHMMINLGLPYEASNISDTMFYIRHAHDAVAAGNGGPPLGLKEYATKYIDSHANVPEKIIQSERSAMAKTLNTALKNKLQCTLATLDGLFKDPLVEIADLPERYRTPYMEWFDSLPLAIQNNIDCTVGYEHIPYNLINRHSLNSYAMYDIVYTLEIYIKLKPVVEARKTMGGIEVENKLIYPLVRMERSGFDIDRPYLYQAKQDIKAYTLQRRERLYELAGEPIKIGQHAAIKELLNTRFNVDVPSTGKEELDQTLINLKINDKDNPAIEFIECVQELRTLEKWYSTYIMRFMKDLKNNSKLYPTIFSVGTVSGRVTSDWQQMPKGAVSTIDGIELFHPRKIVKGHMVTIDFSQIELRLQALYTILVGSADTNLCRAYMPYKCYCMQEGQKIEFDYTNPEHVLDWAKPIWFHDEDDSPWKELDVHSATTKLATGLDESHPDFKKLRTAIGKRTNFAKNYGAQYAKIRSMFPEKSEEECHIIDEAYYKAFPGVKAYHNYCYARSKLSAYTENLYGIRYFGVNGHKLINMLVQGSAAYYLKEKIIAIDKYIQDNKLETKLIFQVHDELIFVIPNHELEHAYQFKRIMEENDYYVPIVAEIDATKTNWADKKPVKGGLDQLKEMMN